MQKPSPRARRGSVFVEFALFFILFLTLLLGIMEMGVLIWTKSMITHAARQGARQAAVFRSMGLSDAVIKNAIQKHAVGVAVNPSDITLNYKELTKDGDGNLFWVNDPSRARGSFIEVQISHTHRLVTGFVLPVKEIQLRTSSRALLLN